MATLTAEAASNLLRNDPDHYLDRGEGKGEVAVRTVGSGPDFLFVHGWPVHGATFRLLLPHLDEHVTCDVVDLPGAGSSRYDTNTDLSIANRVEIAGAGLFSHGGAPAEVAAALLPARTAWADVTTV